DLPDNPTPHMIPIDAAPNGIPSVHMATALLIFWFLRRWWWGSLIGLVFILLTILATLGLGQHYLFDLICAIPYAALVYLLAAWWSVPSLVSDLDPKLSRVDSR